MGCYVSSYVSSYVGFSCLFQGGIPLNRSFSVLNRSEPFRGEVKTAKNHVRNHVRNQAKKQSLEGVGQVRFSHSVSRAKPVATDHVCLAIAITRLTVTHFHEPHHSHGLMSEHQLTIQRHIHTIQRLFKGPLFT